MTPILKYPRTPHITGSRIQPGDEDLKQVAENLVDPAADKTENIPLPDDRKQRSELAQQVTQQLDQALNPVSQEQQQMHE